MDTLRETQFAPAKSLAAYQLQLIERLARHAQASVPFHGDRLTPLFRGGRFDIADWHNVPLMTRNDIRSQGPALFAPPDSFAAEGASQGKTSGTTGMPLKYRQSGFAIIASACQNERMFEAHDLDRRGHKAFIRAQSDGSAPYPLGRNTSGWNLTFPWARASELEISTPIDDQAEWLMRRHPRYLMSYGSNAAAIARWLHAQGMALELSAVLTVGETVDDEIRQDVERGFGCNIIDSYGASETGYIAFECPAGGGYHVCAESMLVEILGDDGAPVPPGMLGRIVVTSLYNYAMPLLRYAIGDYGVAADGPCRCGRTLPRLASIAGRSRNVFTFIDGSQRSLWKWRGEFRHAITARKFQIVQTAPDLVELRYVPLDGAPAPDPRRVAEIGRKTIHPTVLVIPVCVDDIARTPSGKIEDCISLVTPSLR